jgi:hypothetical protein
MTTRAQNIPSIHIRNTEIACFRRGGGYGGEGGAKDGLGRVEGWASQEAAGVGGDFIADLSVPRQVSAATLELDL